jgi:hypothetical protein
MKLMTSRRLGLAALAVAVAAATTVVVACSSDDNSNPGPVTVYDGGVQTQADTSVPPTDSATGPQPDASTGLPDAQVVIDANLPDVGSCVSDASTCNSCYTPAQNPLYGCSPFSVNCLPVDNTRVPANAP